MKKLALLGVLVGILFFTGCSVGNKTLNCTKSGYSSGLSYTQTENVSFTGNKVTTYEIKLKFDLTRYATDPTTFNKMVETLRTEYLKAIEPGVMTTVYPEGNFVNVIFTITMSNFDGYLDYLRLDLSSLIKNLYSPSQSKTSLENSGYSCTLN